MEAAKAQNWAVEPKRKQAKNISAARIAPNRIQSI
jgi:hypothetical protein